MVFAGQGERADMQELLDKLQARLGLRDWQIRVEFRDPLVFDEKGRVDWDGE